VSYHQPQSTREALDLLTEPQSYPVGGGTDLLVTMREGLVRPQRLVDLRALPEIDHVRVAEDRSLSIGAGARVHTLGTHDAIRRLFPALAEACESVGSPALRNMGTIGGSLCQRPRCWYFRSGIPCLKSGGGGCPARDGENRHHVIFGGGPCFATHPSDPAVALTALEAVVNVAGPQGTRAVPIADFFVLPDVDPTRETVLERGEFVLSVEVPAGSATSKQRYIKVLQRGAWDFALASVAVVKREDGAVRMVLGGVAPGPWRVSESVEEDVASGPLAEDDLDALAQRALYDARPLSQNAYKVDLARVLLRQAMSFASAA
jgi:xanthine dehydrogenase YagS FAD-binding subunit